MTIGTVFAVSLIVAPVLNQWIGVPGIFAMTGVLAILAMVVVKKIIPDPQISRFHSDTEASAASFGGVLRNTQLLRLNYGIFALHAALMALWLVVPLTLHQAGIIAADHWQIYLPVLILSVVLIIPAIIYAEKKAKLKPVFIAAIALLLAGQISLAMTADSVWGTAIALLVFFTAFNLLEASLPSLISKIAPVGAKGTAIGIYSSTQFLGTFVGAAAGGYLFGNYGSDALYTFCGLLLIVWLIIAITMKAPAAVRSKMYHVQEMDINQSRELSHQLAALPGVNEALVLANEGVAYLKVDMQGFDEEKVIKLLEEGNINGISQ
jgi:predicted MFS family arabinose efflux permease